MSPDRAPWSAANSEFEGAVAPDISHRVRAALGNSTLASEGGAYTAIFYEDALEAAGRDMRPAGPLQDYTIAVKDLIAIAGSVQGAGSRSRQYATPSDHDAPVVSAFRAAGAVVLGLTTLHEIAFGVTGINDYAGTPMNPHDPARVPGGSSSGSAVAVATGSADLALGSDTGGSIRIPAAFCGVVGYKPPFGVWPTEGVLPLAPSLDHVGILARSVSDIVVADSLFSLNRRDNVTDASSPGSSVRFKLGVVGRHLANSDPEVAAIMEGVLRLLVAHHDVVECEMPEDEDVLSISNTIIFAEGATTYAESLADPESGLGAEVRKRLEIGALISKESYHEARTRAKMMTEAVISSFDDLDAVIEPTVPIVAPLVEEARELGFRLVAHTRLADVTGLPAISIPVPTRGLPVGLQITARNSARLFAVASDLERLLNLLR